MHAPETTEMVECLVKRTTWYNGEVAAPGTVVSLTRADAQYAASIGRVDIVQAAGAEAVDGDRIPAAAIDQPVHPGQPNHPPRRSKAQAASPQTAVTLEIHDVTSGQSAQEVT